MKPAAITLHFALWLCLAATGLALSARSLAAEARRASRQQAQQHCLHTPSMAEATILREPKVLKDFIQAVPKVHGTGTWLQIGANTLDPDGAKHQVEDPLLDFLPRYAAFRKVLVEPIPPLFDRLKRNTQSMPNVHLVNAAIVASTSTASTIAMFCPPAEEMVEWLVGICSMDENVVLRATSNHKPQRFDVQALTVESLFKSHSIQDVRVVMIDTEGFDVKILKLLPFHDPTFKPDLVVFEHTEISVQEHEEGKEFLRSHCYALAHDRENTFGLKLY